MQIVIEEVEPEFQVAENLIHELVEDGAVKTDPSREPLMENCNFAGLLGCTEQTHVEKIYVLLGLTEIVWHHTDVLGVPAPFTIINLPLPVV